jgi:hypothetical protein
LVDHFAKLSLLGKQPVRLARQLNPRSLDLAFRTLEKDKGADPINLPLEGTIRLLGRGHACGTEHSAVIGASFLDLVETSGVMVWEALCRLAQTAIERYVSSKSWRIGRCGTQKFPRRFQARRRERFWRLIKSS